MREKYEESDWAQLARVPASSEFIENVKWNVTHRKLHFVKLFCKQSRWKLCWTMSSENDSWKWQLCRNGKSTVLVSIKNCPLFQDVLLICLIWSISWIYLSLRDLILGRSFYCRLQVFWTDKHQMNYSISNRNIRFVYLRDIWALVGTTQNNKL